MIDPTHRLSPWIQDQLQAHLPPNVRRRFQRELAQITDELDDSQADAYDMGYRHGLQRAMLAITLLDTETT